MPILDIVIFFGILSLIVAFGLTFSRRAGKNLDNFFLGGRSLPWYIAGLSMVATTFAADTPLAVTELVGMNGISGNWLWWNMLAGGMLTTFFFADLWRRSGVMTEVELIELRYSGKAASFLRGFKAVYLGLFMNVLVIGWVNLALMTLLQVYFDLSTEMALLYTAIAMAAVAIYSSLSGLLGVVYTDVVQFFLAMIGCVALAIFVLNAPEVGGISGLKESLPPGALDFFPAVGETPAGNSGFSSYAVGVGTFFAFIGIQWWASWYPGAEPGGGGYIAQRMMSARDEKQAVYATLFFQIAHYCIRPWPWIIVGLAALSLFNFDNFVQQQGMTQKVQQLRDAGVPDKAFSMNMEELIAFSASDKAVKKNLNAIAPVSAKLQAAAKAAEASGSIIEQQTLGYVANTRNGFVYAMKNYLPTGWTGLLLAAFFAAYMSTISTQLNWGASYIVNDLYHRFLNPTASQEQLVRIARITTLILMLIGLVVSSFINSISGVWAFIIECGAGLGLVLILRWYWWRITAWSEIVATITPFFVYAACKLGGIAFPSSFFITVSITTIAWIIATMVSKPTNLDKLRDFYIKVQPDGVWGPIRQMTNEGDRNTSLTGLFVCWISALIMTYSFLFASGKLIFQEYSSAGIWIVVAIVCAIILSFAMSRTRIMRR